MLFQASDRHLLDRLELAAQNAYGCIGLTQFTFNAVLLGYYGKAANAAERQNGRVNSATVASWLTARHTTKSKRSR